MQKQGIGSEAAMQRVSCGYIANIPTQRWLGGEAVTDHFTQAFLCGSSPIQWGSGELQTFLQHSVQVLPVGSDGLSLRPENETTLKNFPRLLKHARLPFSRVH